MTIPSSTAFGPYTILERIGAGGMGEVYRALDTRLQREVALKLVSDSFLADGSSSIHSSPRPGTPHTPAHRSHERFLREARSAATLNHPNICAIYDTGEQDGRPYLVMELLEGVTLKQYLRRNGAEQALSPQETVAFSLQAASALAAAHDKGIVHRDIKPANLFVITGDRGRHQIKILDFGLAKRQGPEASPDSRGFTSESDQTSDGSTLLDLTSPGSTVGTVAYMSPEQAKGDALDARSDLFSLGVVMFEMATGRVPFEGSSAAEVFAALLMTDPPPVTSVNPAMPAGLDAIIAKLLAKTKALRYSSAHDLVSDLDKLVEDMRVSGSGVSAVRPSSGSMPVAVETPRKSNVVGIGIAAAVIVVLAAGGFWYHSRTRTASSAPAGTTASSVEAGSSIAKDSVILADFINKTGDPVFDTTLNQALRVQLGQSPVMDIVGQQHLKQSLQFLGRKPDEPLTPALAREIGEREGMKAILTGTIAPVGSAYLITLDAQNTATGDDIATTQATAKDKNAVLDALNQTATEMRAKLGESLASIKKLNTPFGQATTPSLEAFRAYALGDQAHQHGDDIPEAEGFYKRALELDPNLAMAWARLGVIYLNSGQSSKAEEYFTKAYGLTKNVSEREKLYIDAHYYEEVQGNFNKAIETLQVATQEYPLQLDNYINLSVAYLYDGDDQKAMAEIEKAVALQPDDSVALEDVIANATVLDRFTEAKQYVASAQQLGLKGISLLAFSALVPYAEKQDFSAVEKTAALINSREDGFIAAGILSQAYADAGQFEKARALVREGIAKAETVGAKDAQAALVLNEGSIGWPTGDCHDIKGSIRQALALDHGVITRTSAANAFFFCGQWDDALASANALSRDRPQDELLHYFSIPVTRGFLALKGGDAQAALEAGEQARRYDDFQWPAYLRGLAQTKLGKPQAAAAEFEIASKYRGASTFGNAISWGFLRLQVGRAYAAAGDKANAKKNYQLFFDHWKNADPGLQLMADAKKEYAAL